MILYNVTVSVDHDIAEEWLAWMQEVHVPEVLATGFFAEAKIARILAEEDGGKAYSVQYYALTIADFEAYERDHAPRLRTEHLQRYGDKTAAFRTLLHVIHQANGKS